MESIEFDTLASYETTTLSLRPDMTSGQINLLAKEKFGRPVVLSIHADKPPTTSINELKLHLKDVLIFRDIVESSTISLSQPDPPDPPNLSVQFINYFNTYISIINIVETIQLENHDGSNLSIHIDRKANIRELKEELKKRPELLGKEFMLINSTMGFEIPSEFSIREAQEDGSIQIRLKKEVQEQITVNVVCSLIEGDPSENFTVDRQTIIGDFLKEDSEKFKEREPSHILRSGQPVWLAKSGNGQYDRLFTPKALISFD